MGDLIDFVNSQWKYTELSSNQMFYPWDKFLGQISWQCCLALTGCFSLRGGPY